MRRLLQTEIEDVLAVKIINGVFAEGDTALVDVEGDSLVIGIQKRALLPPENLAAEANRTAIQQPLSD